MIKCDPNSLQVGRVLRTLRTLNRLQKAIRGISLSLFIVAFLLDVNCEEISTKFRVWQRREWNNYLILVVSISTYVLEILFLICIWNKLFKNGQKD